MNEDKKIPDEIFDYFDFYENFEQIERPSQVIESENEVRKSIAEIYLNELENYCIIRFDSFSPKFSDLPLDEDNFRTDIYHYLQGTIQREVEKHFEIFQEQFPDLDPKVCITTDEVVYQNSRPLCYWIHWQLVYDVISANVQIIIPEENEKAFYQKNLFDRLIKLINNLPEKDQNNISQIVRLINDFEKEEKENIIKLFPKLRHKKSRSKKNVALIQAKYDTANFLNYILENINSNIQFNQLIKQWGNKSVIG